MSEYTTIQCKCGNSYVTKELTSKCSNCGETNWTAAGGLAYIAIIIAIALFIGIMFGAIAWAILSTIKKLNKWHNIGVIATGILSLYLFNSLFPYAEYPSMSWINYLCNGSGILLSIYNLVELNKLNNGEIIGIKSNNSNNNIPSFWAGMGKLKWFFVFAGILILILLFLIINK
jgi:hypothetical protein